MGRPLTVLQIQRRIATEVDQKVGTPNVGGNEWEYRLELMNRAQDEWSYAHDWESQRKSVWPAVGGATVSLPADFKLLAAPPRLNGENWPVIRQVDVSRQNLT